MSEPAGIRIRYADGTAPLTVRLIYAWNRGDVPAAVMSASSGPKNYIKNQAFLIFEGHPEINRLVMVRAHGPTFFLLRTTAGTWHDVTGKQVVWDKGTDAAA
jgi:hypothetical protein